MKTLTLFRAYLRNNYRMLELYKDLENTRGQERSVRWQREYRIRYGIRWRLEIRIVQRLQEQEEELEKLRNAMRETKEQSKEALEEEEVAPTP